MFVNNIINHQELKTLKITKIKVFAVSVSLVLLKYFPYLPVSLSLSLLICSTIISLSAGYFCFIYYGSLIETRQTILTYWMRHFLAFVMVAVFWHSLEFAALEFPNKLQPWFDDYPNLMCQILQSESLVPFTMSSAIPIFGLTLYLYVHPRGFGSMNHEHGYKVTLAIWILVSLAKIFFVFFKYGTFCFEQKVNMLKNVKGLTIKDITTSPTCLIYGLFDCFVICSILIVKKMFVHRRSRKIMPLFSTDYRPSLYVPSVSEYNQKVLLNGSVFGIQSNTGQNSSSLQDQQNDSIMTDDLSTEPANLNCLNR